jgi:metal-sulfur cluster biosynthetic enzyme
MTTKSKKPRKISKTTKKSTETTKSSKDTMGKVNVFRENMKKIIDPHTGINIIDMNMVQNIVVKEGKVSLDFTPTSPFCPIVGHFIEEIKKAAKNAGFSDCEVNIKGC